MKRFVAIVMLLILVVATTGVLAEPSDPPPRGPAPNSGDGIPDGSGFDDGPFGPREGFPNDDDSGGQNGNGPGPALNSGDGISDGPGWEDGD